jgi:hypothetical protein
VIGRSTAEEKRALECDRRIIIKKKSVAKKGGRIN